jgi:hypothetical protein
MATKRLFSINIFHRYDSIRQLQRSKYNRIDKATVQ